MKASWTQSLAIHLCLALLFFVGVFLTKNRSIEKEVFEIPIETQVSEAPAPLKEVKKKRPIVIKSVNTPKAALKRIKKKQVRQIYGASRNSITSKKAKGISFKKGNTLAKEVDKKVLKKDDVDALPTPTEEYLVSSMPQVLSEVRPQYPQVAKSQRKEGSVVLNVLIDGQGMVRQVKVLEGEEVFRKAAVEAMRKFKFRPATMEGQNVAVRIRYVLRFVLEI